MTAGTGGLSDMIASIEDGHGSLGGLKVLQLSGLP